MALLRLRTVIPGRLVGVEPGLSRHNFRSPGSMLRIAPGMMAPISSRSD